jgi:hypothetical protein
VEGTVSTWYEWIGLPERSHLKTLIPPFYFLGREATLSQGLPILIFFSIAMNDALAVLYWPFFLQPVSVNSHSHQNLFFTTPCLYSLIPID